MLLFCSIRFHSNSKECDKSSEISGSNVMDFEPITDDNVATDDGISAGDQSEDDEMSAANSKNVSKQKKRNKNDVKQIKRKNAKATKTIKSQQQPYPCPECAKCFKWQNKLKRHLLVHTSERPFECCLCHKR